MLMTVAIFCSLVVSLIPAANASGISLRADHHAAKTEADTALVVCRGGAPTPDYDGPVDCPAVIQNLGHVARQPLSPDASVLRVKADGTGDYPNIEAAVQAASWGDTVLLGPGVYRGDGNRDIEIRNLPIVLLSESGPDSTTIDCEASESDPHRAFTILEQEGVPTVIEGIEFANGYAPDRSVYLGTTGGAIYVEQALCRFTDCRFFNNVAVGVGGAVAGFDSAIIMVEDCQFDSSSAWRGGAIGVRRGSILSVTNTEFRRGFYCRTGAGIHGDSGVAVVVRNCLFEKNLASMRGAGVCVENEVSCSIFDCIFRDNSYSPGGRNAGTVYLALADAQQVAHSLLWDSWENSQSTW